MGEIDLNLSETNIVAAIKLPAECTTKSDIRSEVDRIDNTLVGLLAERHGYVTRMAQIKTDPTEAYAADRIEAMVTKRRALAEEMKVDPDQIELLWRTLIDWNVDYERGIIEARLKG